MVRNLLVRNLKLIVLIGITLIVLIVSARLDFSAVMPNLNAQTSPIDSPLSPLESPLATPSPTPTITPFVPPVDGTATATPTRSRRVVNEITHPGEGDAISSFAAIRGTALITSFRRYDVHIAASGRA